MAEGTENKPVSVKILNPTLQSSFSGTVTAIQLENLVFVFGDIEVVADRSSYQGVVFNLPDGGQSVKNVLTTAFNSSGRIVEGVTDSYLFAQGAVINNRVALTTGMKLHFNAFYSI